MRRPGRRLLAFGFLAIFVLNVLVCPPIGAGWLWDLFWAAGSGALAVCLLVGTVNQKEVVRHLSLFGCLVVLVLPFIRFGAKRDRNYERLFLPYVTACQPLDGTMPTGDGDFCGKVVVYFNRGAAWSGRSFPFRAKGFSAQNPDELGSVVFVSVSRWKVGQYLTQLTKMRSHDAMQVTYDVMAVDRRTKQLLAKTTIVAMPPAHNPPRSGEESAEGKANRLLCEWIEKHMHGTVSQ